MEETSLVPERHRPVVDVWTRLAETKKPIIMYGMGDGAEKILAVMDTLGIKPADFMASDEFVRGHSFKGYRVKKLSEIEELYKDFIVVICFGTALPDVLDRIEHIREKYETYAPDVPVIGDGLFDGDYISDHEFEIMTLKSILADQESKECLDALMRYRISGDIGDLRSCETPKSDILDIIKIGFNETYVDLGAYSGDTVEDFLKLTGKRFNKILYSVVKRNDKLRLICPDRLFGTDKCFFFTALDIVLNQCCRLAAEDTVHTFCIGLISSALCFLGDIVGE